MPYVHPDDYADTFHNADASRDVLSGLDGMFVGYLTGEELEAFNAACEAGTAYRSYEGAAGLLGVAKVRFAKASALEQSIAAINGEKGI